MKYPKIQTVFNRDPETKYKTLLEGEYSLPEFEYLSNNEWVFTEKVDGTNVRVIWDKEQLKWKGRTDKATLPPFLDKELDNIFSLRVDLFQHLWPDYEGREVILFGKGYGAKIQKGGGNYREDQSFVLFDVYVKYENSGVWLGRRDVEDIADSFCIDAVPVIGRGSLSDMVKLAKNGGFKSEWGNFIAEGIVARPEIELLNRNGDRIITKIKCKDFV